MSNRVAQSSKESASENRSKVVGWVDGGWEPVDKLAAHLQGIRHKAVSVFLFQNKCLMLQRRAWSKYHSPGLWANACCTHPLWLEPSKECADRRLREELGLEGVNLLHRHQLEYRANVGGGMVEHELVDVFVANVEQGTVITPNSEEVCEVKWIEPSQLKSELKNSPDRYAAWLRIYMDEHEERILKDLLI